MTVPTVAVTCRASGQNGAPIPGAVFTFKLSQTEKFNGFVVAPSITGTADVSGACVVPVWPNALGVTGSAYRVTGVDPIYGRRFLVDARAVIPNSACNLEDVLDLPSYDATVNNGFKAAPGDKGLPGDSGTSLSTVNRFTKNQSVAVAVQPSTR